MVVVVAVVILVVVVVVVAVGVVVVVIVTVGMGVVQLRGTMLRIEDPLTAQPPAMQPCSFVIPGWHSLELVHNMLRGRTRKTKPQAAKAQDVN